MKTELKLLVDNGFQLVEASKLSLSDSFMNYSPKTPRQNELKKLLVVAINGGLHDFYCSMYAPSLTEDRKIIQFVSDIQFRVGWGYGYNCWKEIAESYMPQYGSRLGTITEYISYLGWKIKQLVKSGVSIPAAWEAVCNPSKGLSIYMPRTFGKILASDEKSTEPQFFEASFWVSDDKSYREGDMLLDGRTLDLYNHDFCFYYSCYGWVVLSKLVGTTDN